jgi:hypothetical protein
MLNVNSYRMITSHVSNILDVAVYVIGMSRCAVWILISINLRIKFNLMYVHTLYLCTQTITRVVAVNISINCT